MIKVKALTDFKQDMQGCLIFIFKENQNGDTLDFYIVLEGA